MIIIDEKLVPRIEEGIIPADVFELVDNLFQQEESRLKKLKRYYLGKHDIIDRVKDSHLSNEKVVCNFSKYITDMATGYFLGENIAYTSDNKDIDKLNEAFDIIEMPSHDLQMARNLSIYGRAFELYYSDKEQGTAIMNIASLCPERCYVVYDNTVKMKPLFGVYFYNDIVTEGQSIKHYNIYTKNKIITFKEENIESAVIEPHNIGFMPITEFMNNDDYQGDFENVISLIDAFNILQSDRINDKVQFVSSLLILYNTDLDDEELRKARDSGALSLFGENIKAEYVVKQMDENMSHTLMKDLADNIYQFSMVSNMADELFSGNASGVALKYKLLAFENLTKIKERCYRYGLKRRLTVFLKFINMTEGTNIEYKDINAVFSRGLPQNNKEIADMIAILKSTGIITNETLASQLSFVTHAKKEVEKAEKEEDAKKEKDMEMFGFNELGKNLDKPQDASEDTSGSKEKKPSIDAPKPADNRYKGKL